MAGDQNKAAFEAESFGSQLDNAAKFAQSAIDQLKRLESRRVKLRKELESEPKMEGDNTLSKGLQELKRIKIALTASAVPLDLLLETSHTFGDREKLIIKLCKEGDPDDAEAQLDEAKFAIAEAGDDPQSLRTALDARIKVFAKLVADNGEKWTRTKARPEAHRFVINSRAYSRALRGVGKHAEAAEE